MRTREEAGGPGARGRLRAAWRVRSAACGWPCVPWLPPGARAVVEVGDGPVLLHPADPPGEAPR